MKARFWWFAAMALPTFVVGQGCSTVGSTSKAPVMKVHTGGTKSERQQEYLLKQIKPGHSSKRGIILGLRHFTDGGRPISGAREKDTLTIATGPYAGNYTIDKVLRLVSGRGRKRKRRVIIRIKGAFFRAEEPQHWNVLHSGSLGVATSASTFSDAVTDPKKFPPEVPVGSQLVVSGDGQSQFYTIVGNTIDTKLGKLQRVAYRVSESLPKGLRNLRYQIRVPKSQVSRKLKYQISWRGSALSGYNFTIGINRRRYNQVEIKDLLKSNSASREEVKGVSGKRNAAAVMRYTGLVTLVVGGFLALVRRDDFTGGSEWVPWTIVGAGVALVGGSIPLDVSANGDFLRAADAYNKNIRKKLELAPKEASAKKPANTQRLVSTPPTRTTLYSKQ